MSARFLGGLIAIVGLALFLGAISGPAHAATGYNFLAQFGGSGSTPGLFNATTMPQRLAVHGESGLLFVADRGNNRVQVLEPTEAGLSFLLQINTPAPVGLAVDQATGDLYVSRGQAGIDPPAVLKFNPDSAQSPTTYIPDITFALPSSGPGVVGGLHAGTANALASSGLGVDPVDSSLVVADIGDDVVRRYEPDGSYIGSFDGSTRGVGSFTNIRDLTVTYNGDVVVVDGNATVMRIDRFTSSGAHVGALSVNGSPVPNSYTGNGAVVAADPDVDEVFISSVTTDAAFLNAKSRVYQFEGAQLNANYEAPANMGGAIHGIALRGQGGPRMYAIAGHIGPGNNLFISPVPRIQAFRGLVPPVPVIEQPTGIGPDSATFKGSVNPNGNSSSNWQFEYRVVGAANWQSAPNPPGDAGSGTTALPVEIAVSDLQPNSPYQVRLVARSGDVQAATDPLTFQTPPAAPLASTGVAAHLSTSSATLTGGVNPRNAESSYYFEWGEDTDYGNRIPVQAESVGGGATRVAVTEPVEGLEAGTEYHFRLIAENEFDQRTVGDDQAFTTLATDPGGLQGERGYEMVTRENTAGIPIQPNATSVSEDGNRGSYTTASADMVLPGYDEPFNGFIGARDEDGLGWTTRPFDLPQTGEVFVGQSVAFPVDLSRSLGFSIQGLDPDDQNGVIDIYQVGPDGQRIWLSRSDLVEAGEPQTDTAQVDIGSNFPSSSRMSVDGSVVAFRSMRRLVEEDPHLSGQPYRLYKWSNGDLRIVSKRPNGSYPVGVTLGSAENVVGAVSRDGSRVFWSDGTTIYADVEGRDPIEVGVGSYVGALPDGSRVYYVNAGRLYSFDVDSGVRRDLLGAAQVQGVTAISDDGRRIYLGGNAALDAGTSPNGNVPAASGANFYLLELDGDGVPLQLTFIATVPGGPWGASYSREAAISPDGAVLAFGAGLPLTGTPIGSGRQAFVYSAVSHSLVCASCPRNGSVPAPGNVNAGITSSYVEIADGIGAWEAASVPRRLVSADGTFFFATRTALLAEDENSVRDVYEYRNGHIRLVSRGGPVDGPAVVGGAGVSGETVMFLTDVALDSRDRDPGSMKLYAARIGGGFPAAETPEPGCAGDACQPRATPPPPPVVGSISLAGDGNVQPPERSRESVRAMKLKAVVGSVARLKVRVSGAGRISVAGAAIRRHGTTVTTAGTRTMRIALTARAKRALRKKGLLRAPVKVSYRSKNGKSVSTVVRVTFKQPKAKRVKGTKGGR